MNELKYRFARLVKLFTALQNSRVALQNIFYEAPVSMQLKSEHLIQNHSKQSHLAEEPERLAENG
jgi:hypothetical protein